MVFLLLSIICNAAVYLIFKYFEQKGVRLFPAITVNYITALTIGLLVVPDMKLALEGAAKTPAWLVGGLLLGFSFISVFYLMAITAQRIGVSVTTVASKMSLALAMVLFLLIRPEEKFNVFKGLGLLFAIAGVVLSSMKEGSNSFSWKQLGWPLLILVGSTIVDFGIAYFSSGPSNDSELALYSCLSFGMAAACGVSIMIYKVIFQKVEISRKDVLGGICLGMINYGSIYFLVLSYNTKLLPESSLLPVNNLCVVVLGSFAAVMLFKEKLSKANIAGIVLSVLAIALLIWGEL